MAATINFKNNIQIAIPQTDVDSLGNDILVTKQGAIQLIANYIAEEGHLPSINVTVGTGLHVEHNHITLDLVGDPDYTEWTGEQRAVSGDALGLALGNLQETLSDEIQASCHLRVASSQNDFPLTAVAGDEVNLVTTVSGVQSINKYVFYNGTWHLYSGTVEIPFEIPVSGQPSDRNVENGVTVTRTGAGTGDYIVVIPQPFDRLYIDATIVDDSDNDETSGEKVQAPVDYITFPSPVTINGNSCSYGVQIDFDESIADLEGSKFILICQR